MDADPAGRQRGPASSFSYLLFLMFMFFLMNGNQKDPTYQRTLMTAIDRRILQRTRLSDWVNGNTTGQVSIPYTPGPDDDESRDKLADANRTFVMPSLRTPDVDRLVEPVMSVHSGRSLYQRNVTGFLKGDWKPVNVTLPPPTPVSTNETTTSESKEAAIDMSWEAQRGLMPWLDDKRGSRRASFNVREAREAQIDPDITFLRGNMEFEAGGSSVRLNVEGVHLLGNGRVYMYARPEEQLIDIRILPALLSDPVEVNRTARALLHELDVRVEKMTEALRTGTVASGDADFTSDIASNCSFAIFGKLSPEKHLSGQELAEWTANLEHPTGSSVDGPNPASMNAIAYSENCGLVLEVSDAKSLLMDRFWSKALTYSASFTLVAVFQVFLLVAQMESTSTAATISRVSYLTVAMQVGMDAYAFVTHLTLGVVTENRSSLPLLLPSFLLCLSSLLFGLRYAASIRLATAPTRPPAPIPPTPAQAAANAATARQTVAERAEEAAAAASPTPLLPAAPVNATGGVWADDSPLWLAIPLGCIFTIVVLLAIFSWLVIAVVALYSYWIPQIYSNAERDASRRTLQKRYIIGTALCRLFLPLYVWACPDNILFAQNSSWVYMLVAYQAIQVVLLLLQDYLGPRFFLPKGVFPARERWDYHPILPPSDLEAPNGRAQDCIICLEPIELPNKEEAESLSSHVSSRSRWSYMVPPCHHIAHTRCLESWLAVKSECTKGWICVVSGGGTGIGLMCSQALVAAGAEKVYILGRRREALEQAAKVHGQGKFEPLECDIRDPESIKKAVAKVEKEVEHVDVLINNAGISGPTHDVSKGDEGPEAFQKELLSHGIDDWKAVFETNVFAHYFCSAYFLHLLAKSTQKYPGHSASIINIDSISGITSSTQNHIPYNVSKAAGLQLTKMLAAECSRKGVKVRVVSIAPGIFPSEMTTGESGDDQKSHKPADGFRDEQGIPAGRPGTDADMAQSVLFAACNRYYNGQHIVVDGGFLIRNP